MRKHIVALAVAALAPGGAFALEVPVDLGTWVAEGSGNWNLEDNDGEPGFETVFQSVNTAFPTVFYGPGDAQGTALRGSITPTSGSDDDFIGFVLGFQPGDINSAVSDFILVDWKAGNQGSGCGSGLRGMALSRVTGDIGDNDDGGWCHTGPVTELARAATLGDTGWSAGTEYEFDISFTASNITVLINGVEEFNLNGTFENGRFGFYNYSQPSVRYAGIRTEDLPPPPRGEIPLPAALPLMALGLGGLGFVARRRR